MNPFQKSEMSKKHCILITRYFSEKLGHVVIGDVKQKQEPIAGHLFSIKIVFIHTHRPPSIQKYP